MGDIGSAIAKHAHDNGYTVVGTVAEGDVLNVTVEGSQTSIGRSDNTITEITVTDQNTGKSFVCSCSFTQRQQAILKAGGLLNYTKEGGQ